MQRTCLLLALAVALTVSGPASTQDAADPAPLELDLELEADDALLAIRSGAKGTDYPGAGNAVRSTVNRAGRGYQVRAVLPSLCEGGLPGGQVVDTYNRVMDCENDAVGFTISIRNY